MSDSLASLKSDLRDFALEREWDQFHTPKNLACALSVEVAELLEHFQWTRDSESVGLPAEKMALIAEEIGDVLLYLIRLADKLGIDPIEAARLKLERNADKYPVSKSRGSSKKYTEL